MPASPIFIAVFCAAHIVAYAITPEKHKGFVYYHCTQYNGQSWSKMATRRRDHQATWRSIQKLQMPKDDCTQITVRP